MEIEVMVLHNGLILCLFWLTGAVLAQIRALNRFITETLRMLILGLLE